MEKNALKTESKELLIWRQWAVGGDVGTPCPNDTCNRQVRTLYSGVVTGCLTGASLVPHWCLAHLACRS